MFLDPAIVNPTNKISIICCCVKQWLICVVAVLIFVTAASVWMKPSDWVWVHLADNFWGCLPFVVASLLLLPCFIFDRLKATNQLAGPITRLQADMKKLNNGDTLSTLKFREGDHWAELAQDFNALAEEINRERLAADLTDKKQRVYSFNESSFNESADD
jgi:hypothetical protein